MLKVEDNLELSINALKVYDIEPNIIQDMLDSLSEVVNKCHSELDMKEAFKAGMTFEQTNEKSNIMKNFNEFMFNLQQKKL